MSWHGFSTSGIELRLWDDDHDGLPVVFQHGLGGDEAQVARNFPADSAWRRLTLECRGHGGSAHGPLADLSIAAFTADVIALIEQRLGRPVAIGGISMGAAIALRLTALRPDLVLGLILVRPAWGLRASPRNMAPNARVGRLLHEHAPALARRRFERSPTARMLASAGPDNLASLRNFFDRPAPTVTAALLRQIAADGPGIDLAALRQIAVPTLILANDRDHVHPLAHARFLARNIPGARALDVTAKATKPLRHAEDVKLAIGGFLGGLASGPT